MDDARRVLSDQTRIGSSASPNVGAPDMSALLGAVGADGTPDFAAMARATGMDPDAFRNLSLIHI